MIISPHITMTNRLARVAYDTYWAGFANPTPFAKLTSEGQLKWQNVAKAILSEANRMKTAGNVPA